MPWVKNPPIPTLLRKSLAIDAVISEEYALANPGTLTPSQAVVNDGDVLEVEGGTVTLAVMEHTVAAAFTPAEGE